MNKFILSFIIFAVSLLISNFAGVLVARAKLTDSDRQHKMPGKTNQENQNASCPSQRPFTVVVEGNIGSGTCQDLTHNLVCFEKKRLFTQRKKCSLKKSS